MATRPVGAPAAMMSGIPHSSSAMDALQEFLVTSCAAHEPPDACAFAAVQLDVAPPPAHEQFSLERALGFLFADEMKVARQLQLKYEQGKVLFTKVYFARGCASAVPPAPPAATEASDVPKLLRYYGGVYDVLQPQVAKLRMLCDYSTQTVGILSDTIQRIAAQENTHRVIPDVLLDSILDVMDVVLQLNQLHDTKSSLRNDFSLFKRAFKHVQGDISDPESVAKEILRLQEFVGSTAQSKNTIWDSLRHNLTSVKRYTHVVFLLVKQCLWHLESGRCLQPQEEFKYIRLLPCLMAVLNTDPIDGNLSGFQSSEKRLIEATGKIVGRFPIVPVFADLCVKPMAPVWELNLKSKADLASVSERHWDSAYDLRSVVQQARNEAADFMPRLLFAVNMLRRAGVQMPDDSLSASIASLLIETVRCLSRWKMSISLFLAAKYQRPKTDHQLEHMGVSLDSPYLEYQRVITHNFDRDECAAVADMVATIKTVAQAVRQHAVRVQTAIRSYLYTYIQQFVQHTLVAILHRADKKKHASVKVFQELRLMCGDWLRDDSPVEDYKKRRKERQLPELKRRIIAPSRSQLQMLRSAVCAIYAKRTSGDVDAKASIFAFHRELKSSDIDKLDAFYTHTADFDILLDVDQVVSDLSSFPEMLFRELILEVTKSPQLPVDDSLPWLIVTQTTMDGQRPLDASTMMALLEMYDDAADYVISRSEQVAVYNEIFAESRLFFDNMIYLIGNYVFTSVKSATTRAFLGDESFTGIDGVRANASLSKDASSFAMCQNLRKIAGLRQVRFLDEIHNVMLLVSGHLNGRFMRDLKSTVSRIFRPDTTIHVAATNLVDVLRCAHGHLTEYFTLDCFEALWQEASTSNSSPHGGKRDDYTRLQRMVSVAITQDLVTRFGFNERTQRYYRTPLALELRSYVGRARITDMESVQATKATAVSSSKKLLDGMGLDRDCRVGFELIHQPYRSFVGLQHIRALSTLLTRSDVVQLVDDCIDLVTSQIEDVVHLFIPVLGAAIPPYRLPRLLYRTEGCYGYFESKFRHMMESKELEAHVFHCLRIIGNALLVIHFLDQVTTREDDGLLFPRALQRLYGFLVDTDLVNQWGVEASSNPEHVDKKPATFFLIWNALEYLSCCSPRHGASICHREAYGEGVSFAGCTLLHLLHQRSHYETWNPSQHVLHTHAYSTVQSVTSATVQHAMKKGRSRSGSNPVSPRAAASAQAVGTADAEMIAHTQHFVTHASQMRRTSHHFFTLLENAWSPTPTRPLRSDFAAPT